MAKNNNVDYETLLNQHNRLVARFNDLQTQMEDKAKAWSELERQYKINEKKARALCERIIAKIPSQEFLGQAFSYDKFTTDVLIDKATDAYEEYNARRTELMKKIHAESEKRRIEIENLRTQNEMLKHNSAAGSPVAADPDTGEIIVEGAAKTDAATAAEIAENAAKMPKGTSYQFKKAAQEGGLNVITITEEDEDVSLEEMQHLSDAAVMRMTAQIEDSGIKVTPSQKRIQQVKKIEQAASSTVLISKDEVLKNLNERSMEMLRVIGKTGVSDTDTLRETMTRHAEEIGAKISRGTIMYSYNLLVNNQVLATEVIAHPIKGKFQIFWLTEIGGVIYKDETGEMPVQAQCMKVRKEHDNFEHGYGILSLRDIVEEKSNNFKTVSCDRKDNEITLKDGNQYVPDVTAIGKYKAYFEYELDNHNQTNFNVKMNKMALATRFLNIVVPNRDAVKSITPKIELWIKSRGGPGCLPGYKVRLTSLPALAKVKGDINADSSWTTIFDLSSQGGTETRKPNNENERSKESQDGRNIPRRIV